MNIEIRALGAADVGEADRIFRLAFGAFLGLPDPMQFAGDSLMVASRYRAAPDAALGAYVGDELVGSNFAARWGSFGFFGPLTVRPDYWNRGVAQALLGPTMALFERWGVRQAGLFTFADSAKHHALYGKHGFKAQARTPVLARALDRAGEAGRWTTLSALLSDERAKALAGCRAITDEIFAGLDVSGEIRAVVEQGVGDIVLAYEGDALGGFAVCHAGAGSEAGTRVAYAKFAAARPGPGAAARFESLLAACEAYAQGRGLPRLVAGVNAAREDAHRILEARGYEAMMEGVAMQRPDAPGFNRPDCYVVDDWR
jgi:GNAT superfamily N-acetyltransferase